MAVAVAAEAASPVPMATPVTPPAPAPAPAAAEQQRCGAAAAQRAVQADQRGARDVALREYTSAIEHLVPLIALGGEFAAMEAQVERYLSRAEQLKAQLKST